MALVPLPALPFNQGRGRPERTGGAWWYVNYGVAGEPWHERLIILPDPDDEEGVWVLTPGWDVYMERLSDYVNVMESKLRRPPTCLRSGAGQPVHRSTVTPGPRDLEQARATCASTNGH